jgi:hypothetical protein
MRARRAGLVLAIMAGLPLSAYAQSAAPEPAPLPVSLERVKRGLERPAVLDLPGRRPAFSVSVTETLTFDNPFGVEKAAGANWADLVSSRLGSGVTPLISLSAATASMAGDGNMSKPMLLMDAIAIGTYVAGKIGRSLHARKVRDTRSRVQQELAEFCAANGCVAPPP